MGYTTDFKGKFNISKELDEDTLKLLMGLATTRRMKRDMSKLFPDMSVDELYEKFGTDGEFYIEESGFEIQYNDKSIVDYNEPPSTQPGLWCQWTVGEDKKSIVWDGGEKFYDYVEWIEYLINSVLKPRGYVLNGEVNWFGENRDDIGTILVKDNVVLTKRGFISYS